MSPIFHDFALRCGFNAISTGFQEESAAFEVIKSKQPMKGQRQQLFDSFQEEFVRLQSLIDTNPHLYREK